jgi:hypothetical protein
MKTCILVAILTAFLSSTGYPQDKIITLKKDTIDCKIIKVSKNYVFFAVSVKGIRSSGKLPVDSLLNYSISVKTAAEEKTREKPDPFERLQLGISGGPGFLFASSEKAEIYMESMGLDPGLIETYYSDLKSGINVNADISFMVTPKYGAGFKYRFLITSAIIEGFFDPGEGANLFYSTYEEQIYVNYFGPMFAYRQSIGNKNLFKLNLNCSIGLATYRNEVGCLSNYLLLTAKDFGMEASVGMEFLINRKISITADLSAFYATFSKMKASDGSSTTTLELEKENYEDLSRLDLSLGIRFYIFKR